MSDTPNVSPQFGYDSRADSYFCLSLSVITSAITFVVITSKSRVRGSTPFTPSPVVYTHSGRMSLIGVFRTWSIWLYAYAMTHNSPLKARVTSRLATALRVRTAISVETAYRMPNANVRSGMRRRNFGFHSPLRSPRTSHTLPTDATANMNMNDIPPMYL